jgi:hypothetical protein
MRRRLSSFQGAHNSAIGLLYSLQNMSYNELASTAIDQVGTMRACEESEEKKRKRTMPGPTRGSSSGAPLMYRIFYTPPVGQPRYLL